MRIFIPSALRSYTGQQDEVEAEGNTVGELLSGLNARFPGLRFRIIDEQDQIRAHIKIFVNQEQARDLNVPLQPADQISILLALSGGQGFSLRAGLRTIE